APFGPISPTTSPRPTWSETPASARTPSNERITEEARRVSPGLLSPSVCVCCDKPLDLRDDLRDDGPDHLRLVVLNADHPVLASEHGVQARREAHEARQRRHVVELLHLRSERHAGRR